MPNLVPDIIDDYLEQYESQYVMVSHSDLLDGKTENSAESFLAELESLHSPPWLLDLKQSVKFVARTEIRGVEKSETLHIPNDESEAHENADGAETQPCLGSEEVPNEQPQPLTAEALAKQKAATKKVGPCYPEDLCSVCSSSCSSATWDTHWEHPTRDPRAGSPSAEWMWPIIAEHRANKCDVCRYQRQQEAEREDRWAADEAEAQNAATSHMKNSGFVIPSLEHEQKDEASSQGLSSLPLPASQQSLPTSDAPKDISPTTLDPENMLLTSSQELRLGRISDHPIYQMRRNIDLFSAPPLTSNYFTDPKTAPNPDTTPDISFDSNFGYAKNEAEEEMVCEWCRDMKEHKRSTKEIGIAAVATGLLVVGLAVLEKKYLG